MMRKVGFSTSAASLKKCEGATSAEKARATYGWRKRGLKKNASSVNSALVSINLSILSILCNIVASLVIQSESDKGVSFTALYMY